ncbi:MAG: twin-arginine translocation signal domain-containing protein [Verrucomicrobia bacterium]|nr:twin-arginine translocation signal domain-containing protein [Verrucomicrobiota bacterium]
MPNAPDISRRGFLKSTAVGAGALALGAGSIPVWGAASARLAGLTVADLPKGAAPPPVGVPHFPDRLHAFVWRNWPLVPVARMAQVVGATAADIERMGGAMGLGKPPRISREQMARSYITVIRRNWHLLPYAQLLQLLDWTAEKLAYTLREDDFLYVKLGNLKPQCEPLRYHAPDEAARERENEIQRMVREEFPQGAVAGSEPLFGFVSQLSRKPAKNISRAPAGHLKFCYSYFALYGDPLLEIEADPYPEGYLARLANSGVTGVWLQAVLYKLAPFPWEPERSLRYQDRLKNLRKLVARAAKHGIGVFLYLNEPRAMPLRFFESHPQLKGAAEGDHAALCTSAPEVQRLRTSPTAGRTAAEASARVAADDRLRKSSPK